MHSAPKTRVELKAAVDTCLRSSSIGNCPTALGPIGEWDVSSVTDMQSMFSNAQSFNADISKWGVSRLTNMQYMFYNAQSFNADISKWDVSSVTNMENMFKGTTSFSRTLCGSGWMKSQVQQILLEKQYSMFTGSSAQICFGNQCHSIRPATQPVTHLSTH